MGIIEKLKSEWPDRLLAAQRTVCEQNMTDRLVMDTVDDVLEEIGIVPPLLANPVAPSQTTVSAETLYQASLFLHDIVLPTLNQNYSFARGYIVDLDRNAQYLYKSYSYWEISHGVDLDNNGQLTSQEIALYAYAVPEYLEEYYFKSIYDKDAPSLKRIKDAKPPVMLTQEYLCSYALKELKKSTTNDPVTLGRMKQVAEDLLANIASQLNTHADNLNFWVMSLQVWEILLSIVEKIKPDDYSSYIRHFAEFYSKELLSNPGSKNYARLFYFESHRRYSWWSISNPQAVYKYKEDIKYGFSPIKVMSYLTNLSWVAYYTIAVRDLKIDNVAGDQWLVNHAPGYTPRYFANQYYATTSCPETFENLVKNKIPSYEYLTDPKKFWDCYGSLLFGQDSRVYDLFSQFLSNPRVPPLWTRLLNNPDNLSAQVSLVFWLTYSDTKKSWSLALRRKVVEQQASFQQIKDTNGRIISHRADSKADLYLAQSMDTGMEVDIFYGADGHWRLDLDNPNDSSVNRDLKGYLGNIFSADEAKSKTEKDRVVCPIVLHMQMDPEVPIQGLNHLQEDLNRFKEIKEHPSWIIISSSSLAVLEELADIENHPALGYFIKRESDLQVFIDHLEIYLYSDPSPPPFSTLFLYGAHYRQLSEEQRQQLSQHFSIILYENSLDLIQGLPYSSVIVDVIDPPSLGF